MTKTEAGRLGGLSTLKRHGREHFSAMGQQFGKLGGRPRKDLELILYQRRAAQKIKKGELPRGMTETRRLLAEIKRIPPVRDLSNLAGGRGAE